MASGEDDRDNLTEEARRRRAEADELRSKSSESSYYSPDEKSFFAPTSEDRAEQARRAASRVRRRAAEGSGDASEPAALQSDSIVPRVQDTEQKPPAPEPTSKASVPNETKPAQTSGSILDRAVGLAGVTKKAVEQPTPPPSEKPSTGGGSIMDRAVQRPARPAAKPEPETPPKPEIKKAPPASESLMDRAMTRPVPPPKLPEPFVPKSVLSVASKPSKAPPQKPSPVNKPANPTGPAVAKGSPQVPLAERLKQLAESKAPASAPDELVTKVIPAPRVPPKKNGGAPAVTSPAPRTVKVQDTPVPSPVAKTAKMRDTPPAAPAAKTVRVQEAAVAAPAAKPVKVQDTPVVASAPLRSAAVAVSPMAADTIYADGPAVTPAFGVRTAKTKAFAAFEWMIASRYLRARKKEGFVSVIAGFSLVGIALGVATLIVVMAVMTGFRDTLVTQIIGGSPHINVYSQSDKFENYDALADQIRVVDGVLNVTPVVQGQVLGTGNSRHTGVIVRGMRKADLERLIANAEPEVINGTLENFVEDKGVAIGGELAAKLGLRVGDFITLISPDGDITPFQATPMPRVKDYKIIQTFKLGVQEIDYGVAFMPFAEAQIYFNKQNQADTLDVFVDDPQSVSGSLRNIEPGSYEDDIFQSARSSISVNNWKNLNGRLIGAINLERQVMFVILTMIILVAALNIISGLVMLVKDKARDVAIMRTMGMARGSVLRIFFICGSSIGVIGSLAGVLLGVLFVWNIHAIQGGVEWITGTRVWDPSVRAGITEIPTKLLFSDVALTLFIALGLSFFATLFPAWKAAKLDPVEALRYE